MANINATRYNRAGAGQKTLLLNGLYQIKKPLRNLHSIFLKTMLV